ncbi:hypothetical protein CJ030_MR7G016756 [Morella rubra]|uniref:Uncharacterized protein n=1 Tax=Morella rubra TaxID=262757 RepID=A0A6A1UXL1_9ROSI|nr:hypothetical protein CJ030_MR7G016756 [Morella rubra]
MSIPTSAAHANYGSFSMTMIMLLLLSLRCSLEQAMLKVEVLHSWFFSFLWPSKILDLITLFSDCVLLLFLATRTSIKNPYIWFLPTKSFPAAFGKVLNSRNIYAMKGVRDGQKPCHAGVFEEGATPVFTGSMRQSLLKPFTLSYGYISDRRTTYRPDRRRFCCLQDHYHV